MAFRDNLAKLRSLAGEHGYRLEQATSWQLVDGSTGAKVTSDCGSDDGGRTSSSHGRGADRTPDELGAQY